MIIIQNQYVHGYNRNNNDRTRRKDHYFTTTTTTTRRIRNASFLFILVLLLASITTTTYAQFDGIGPEGFKIGTGTMKHRKPRKERKVGLDSDDYYQILGVTQHATQSLVKAAYRKLALQYHPDKVPEEERESALDKFQKISEAYSVLSNEEQRKVYAKYGKSGLEAMADGMSPEELAGGHFGSTFGSGFPGGGFSGNTGTHTFHFDSAANAGGSLNSYTLFEEMFGGGGGFGGGGRNYERPILDNDEEDKVSGGLPHKPPPQIRTGGGDLFPKGESQVVKLGSPKFPDATSRHLWFVMFYSRDSSASAQAEASVEELALKAKEGGTFKVGAVDCKRSAKETDFCFTKTGIETLGELPKFAVVVDGEVRIYEDDTMTGIKALYEFAMEELPKNYMVHNLNHKNQLDQRLLQAPAAKDKLGCVLLLTDKVDTSALLFSLSYQYRQKLLMAESRSKNLSMSREFGVKQYPTLLVFAPKDKGEEPYTETHDLIRYKGEYNPEAISKWLEELVADLEERCKAD